MSRVVGFYAVVVLQLCVAQADLLCHVKRTHQGVKLEFPRRHIGHGFWMTCGRIVIALAPCATHRQSQDTSGHVRTRRAY
jgi:hypothetical protein